MCEEERDRCTRCGRLLYGARDEPMHMDDEGDLWKTCRAASFTEETGHDDSLDPRWVATRPT